MILCEIIWDYVVSLAKTLAPLDCPVERCLKSRLTNLKEGSQPNQQYNIKELHPWVYTINSRKEKYFWGAERRRKRMDMDQIRSMEDLFN